MNTHLQKAAQAMIDRWDSTDWKDTPHTAHYVAELRKTLDAELAQSAEPEPVAWMYDWSPDAEIVDTDVVTTDYDEAHSPTMACHNIRPLYLHPPQPHAEPEPSGERAELIARLAKQWAELDPADPYRADIGKAADMLEADAQQAKPHYDQQALELCNTCGWKGIFPGDPCLVCAQQAKSKDAELIATHAKLAEAELRSNQLESQFKSQCRITASALDERAQQAKRVPMTEKQIDKIHADTARLAQIRTTFFIAFARAIEAHHGITTK